MCNIYYIAWMSSLWSQEEEARRRDFRQECVFTIDPETARVGVSVGVAMEMYNIYAYSLFTCICRIWMTLYM